MTDSGGHAAATKRATRRQSEAILDRLCHLKRQESSAAIAEEGEGPIQEVQDLLGQAIHQGHPLPDLRVLACLGPLDRADFDLRRKRLRPACEDRGFRSRRSTTQEPQSCRGNRAFARNVGSRPRRFGQNLGLGGRVGHRGRRPASVQLADDGLRQRRNRRSLQQRLH